MLARILNIIIGIAVTAAPELLSFTAIESDINYISGPFILAIATVALWRHNRNIRWFNTAFGIWLMLAVFIFSFSGQALIFDGASGFLLAFFSLIDGNAYDEFGGGWKALL